jgi:hypothetical protein
MKDAADDVDIKNNIFVDGAYAVGDLNDDCTNITEDYNQFYSQSSGTHYQVDAGENSQTGDPLFTNADGNIFKLQSTSPCIDEGTDVGLTSDFDGNRTPEGSDFDIGAYEYYAPGGANYLSNMFAMVLARKKACVEAYAYDSTANADASMPIGGQTDRDYVGVGYEPASRNECICQVDLYIDTEVEGGGAGNLDGAVLYSKIWNIDGSGNITSLIDSNKSNGITGSTISADSWITFEWDDCVWLTYGDDYAVTFYRDDADDGTPDIDTDDYFTFGYDNDNAPGETELTGGGGWEDDGALPYPIGVYDADDDPIIRIYEKRLR